MGSVDDDLMEARFLRRLEYQFQSKFDRLNEEIERLNADNKMLKADTKALKEIVNKQEILIAKLLNKEQGRDENNDVIAAGWTTNYSLIYGI